MKYALIICIILSVSFHALSQGTDEKVFLVLFDKNELQKIETSTAYIELNFLERFPTKSYSGHSDAAILITIPQGNMDECQIGETMVQINNSTWIPLHEIAFRIIDLAESRHSYQALLG